MIKETTEYIVPDIQGKKQAYVQQLKILSSNESQRM
uniref:Uncharacterized protein n=1 Tax=Rhizophora mucronata TaxID=61149 RepID=A0A2P2NTI5_RHIMU